MADDLTSRLRDAAGPLPTLDEAALDRMVRRPARRFHVAISLVVCVVVGGLIVALTTRTESVDLVAQPAGASNSDQPPGVPASEPSSDQPPGVANSEPSAEEPPRVHGDIVASSEIAADLRASGPWQVLAVARPTSGWRSYVSRTQAELDEAWASFDVDGDPPALPTGHAALLVNMPGTCTEPSAVLGVEQLRALTPAGTFFAIHVDPACALNDRDRVGNLQLGPRTLVAVSIPSDAARTAVGVEPVTASVADPDWDLLAIETDPTGGFLGARASDADSEVLEWVWSNWNLTGEVPQLPDDRRAYLAEVPGSCTDPSSLVRVEAMGLEWDGSEGHGTVMLIMQFDHTCATIAPGYLGVPQSVYAVTLDTAVSENLHSNRSFLVCPPGVLERACDNPSTEQHQTLEGDRLVAFNPRDVPGPHNSEPPAQ